MGIRWVIHKKDGRTIISDWDSNAISFRKHWDKTITSIQLQRKKDSKLFTLSARKNSDTIFWQTDDFIVNPNTERGDMISRRIFKNLAENIWLELVLINGNDKPKVNIIEKKIGIN